MEEMRAPLEVCALRRSCRSLDAARQPTEPQEHPMKFTDAIPNLIVSDVDRSAAFYKDVLGFSTVVATVPDAPPFVFVWLQRDGVSVFLNAHAGVQEDLPTVASRPLGGTNTIFLTLEADTPEAGIDALFGAVEPKAKVLMPLKTQFYGMREFAVEDPDGYVIICAQPVGAPT
jgi:catechol 2,3-dioxygenase-like lactoylglutathione lyase family enzyme